MLGQHGVLGRADGYMNKIPVNAVYRDMLLDRCIGDPGYDLLHLFTAADDGYTAVSYCCENASAVLADIEFLFHKHGSFRLSESLRLSYI